MYDILIFYDFSYFILDKEKTLRENLIGKTIVEFPTLVVVLSNLLCKYLDNSNSDQSSGRYQLTDFIIACNTKC